MSEFLTYVGGQEIFAQYKCMLLLLLLLLLLLFIIILILLI